MAVVAIVAHGGSRFARAETEDGMAARMRWSVFALALLLPAATVLAEEPAAAPGSFRAAQETGLDLSLRPVDLLNIEPQQAAAGSFRAAQDAGLTTPWSREVGPKWSLEGYQGPAGPPAWGAPRQPVGLKLKREL